MSLTRTLTGAFGVTALAAIGLTTFLPCPSRADDENATIGDVLIDGVAATPAKAGETTRITFSVENAGSDRVIITGVRWPSGEPARVMGFLGSSHGAVIGALPVGPGEVVRLDGRTAWIEVGPLKSDLVPGSVVQARLVLGRSEAPLPIHVSRAVQNDAAADTTATVESKRWWC